MKILPQRHEPSHAPISKIRLSLLIQGGDMFQDPQERPRTMESTKSYTMFFPNDRYPH